jgi:glycosyltransferase involved in cell wall biosynthesis
MQEMMPQIEKKTHTVWVNGRFLSRKVTGVERVAREILHSLDSHFLDDQASCTHNGLKVQFKIAHPVTAAGAAPLALGRIPVHVVGKLTGHAWEQLSLNAWAGKDWILNLCNTGPLLRKRQSIFFHDAQVFAIPNNFDWKFRLWYRILLHVSGRRSAGLFTNSCFSKDELSKFTGIAARKFEVLHLGADHMLRLAPSLPQDMAAQVPQSPFLLAVSSASPNKNFSAVIQAIRLLGDQAPPCVFVGQKYTKVFNDRAVDVARVTELGYVSDEALAALYSRALCLVYPSFYEGFGLPPLEAMTYGTPVVTSNTSSLPEVCADAALYCDPSRPQTLADAIRDLQTNTALQHRLRAAGQERAAAFTWKACAQNMLDGLCTTLAAQR